MKTRKLSGVGLILTVFLVTAILAGCVGLSPSMPLISARQLIQPGALGETGPSDLNWSPVGSSLCYTDVQGSSLPALWLYDAATNSKRLLLDSETLDQSIDFSSAQWSPDGSTLLLEGENALWLLDVASATLKMLVTGNQDRGELMWSPDGKQVTFTQDHDLYLADLSSSQVRRLTKDGGDAIFNGCLDWVYTEELATRNAQPAYAWSPDGQWIVYLRLDDSAVSEHPVTNYRPTPPTVSWTRYPTAGTPNPKATLWAIRPAGGEVAYAIPLPADTEYILPFISWTNEPRALFLTLNRDHTVLKMVSWSPLQLSLSRVDRTEGVILEESDPAWINESYLAAPIPLPDGKGILWLSEREGFMHLYRFQAGEPLRQLTQGPWLIDSLAGNLLTPGQPVQVDPSGSYAYFSTTEKSPLERQLARLNLATGQLDYLTSEPGFHFASLSGDGQYLAEQFSNQDTPPVITIRRTDGAPVAILGRNAGPTLALPKVQREFLTVKANDGTLLYAQLIKPEHFNPNLRYPVVVHWYGGPSLQLVTNQYGSTSLFNPIERDTLYTQAGFLVWRLDNRGSAGRGHAFETPILMELGKVALEDQLAGVAYLRTLPYVEPTRIGTDGKSFGGFLTLYALIHAPGVFRCGVAGSGPTDWSDYDTIYTERYMRTPAQNPEGYAATNLVAQASQISARPLIIHGLNDTNVHLANSVNFVEALEAADKPFDFLPLPNLSHHYGGDGLAACLEASVDFFLQSFYPR